MSRTPAPSRLMRGLAYAVPLAVLPSSAWRVAALLGVHGEDHPVTRAIRGDAAYVIFLSAASLLLASLAIGLVERWGLVFPRWLPAMGGRRVPMSAALIPAALGAAFGTAVSAYAVLNGLFHFVGPLNPEGAGMPPMGPELAIVQACYAPLLLAGPLLAVVAWDYRRRRLEAAA